MKYKGVIFDFNGVLLWDSPLHVRAWQKTALELSGRPLSDEEFRIHVHGRTNAYILGHITGRTVQGPELTNLTQFKETIYRDLCLKHPEQFVLSPGARQTLDFLAAENIPRTIATASEKTNLDFFIHHLELENWFDSRLMVYDDGVLANKPSPDIYTRAAARIRLPARDCVVVEDSLSGVQAAHAAGIGCIIALGAETEQSRLSTYPGVSLTIESLEQFPKHILTSGWPPPGIAGLSDYDSWLALAKEVEPLFGPMSDLPGFQQALKTAILESRAFCFKEDTYSGNNGISAGIVISTRANRIEWFAVSAKFRRKRLGEALLRFALDHLDATRPIVVQTFDKSSKEGIPARNLYRRYGFMDFKPKEATPAGIPTVLMIKPPPESPITAPGRKP